MLTTTGREVDGLGLESLLLLATPAPDALAAKQAPVARARPPSSGGEHQFMSPEQVEGKEVDGREDIFSLGAVLLRNDYGTARFQGKSQLR